MTRPNNTRKRPCCPHCRAKIKSLYYLLHQSVTGEFTLASGHEDNLEADQDSIEYSCPKCDADLFEDEESAEAFLLGKKVRPTLLEKKRVMSAEAAQ